MKNFLSNYNVMLNTEGTHINKSVFDGRIDVERKLHKGITVLLREHLKEKGLWDEYLGFNRVFSKIAQALKNINSNKIIANG